MDRKSEKKIEKKKKSKCQFINCVVRAVTVDTLISEFQRGVALALGFLPFAASARIARHLALGFDVFALLRQVSVKASAVSAPYESAADRTYKPVRFDAVSFGVDVRAFRDKRSF